MLVHRCDRCCVYEKEIQPCRKKYSGIWAILMHKMMFPSESCNSVSNGTFCEFRPFSVIAEIFSLRTPPEPLRVPLGVRVPQFGNRWPSTTRAGASLSTFKKLLKTQLFREHLPS